MSNVNLNAEAMRAFLCKLWAYYKLLCSCLCISTFSQSLTNVAKGAQLLLNTNS